jgi:hypothetical protein
MKIIGKFILLDATEFEHWLAVQKITRKIKWVQYHHTYIPAYKHFKGDNHFKLCQSMEAAHKERGFSEIAQNITIFPDGKVMICRNLNTIPAGIKGANTYGVCIENIGNFDKGMDTMTLAQRNSIALVTKCLLKRFALVPSDQTVLYHHWFDLNTGERTSKEGTGVTKTCPGTAFFGGNTVEAFKVVLLPLLKV